MNKILRIRICGFGGQGIVLAGTILGQTAVEEGWIVAGSSSYGAQARSSGCKSDIIISNRPIDYPYIEKADFLIAMSQTGYELYSDELNRKSGIVLYDKSLVNPKKRKSIKFFAIPGTEIAIKKFNNKQVANILFLGVFNSISKLFSQESFEKAINRHISDRHFCVNLSALKDGINFGRRSSD
jgi:2-oxoglutarate ferredoxin oxidoreductase subunit gamma